MGWRSALVWLAVVGSGSAAAQTFPPGAGCDDLGGLPITFDVNWQTQVKPIINEMFVSGRCTSCHNPGQFDGDLDLTDLGIDAIYKLLPAGYVIPGRPFASPLFDKINCNQPGFGGLRMPFLQNPLSIEQQGLIFDWIAQGALGDVKGEQTIPRDFVYRDGLEGLR
ncbi:MAG: hypothetical protein ACT4NL_08195 [Pseudomarimonas sp.]